MYAVVGIVMSSCDLSPRCLCNNFTQQVYVNSVSNPSSNCYCEQGTWGNTPDISGCKLCPPGTYAAFTSMSSKPPSVISIQNKPDLTRKCEYYSPTTCNGATAEGTPQPECNFYGWPYGCTACPCGKYNKGYGNTKCQNCTGGISCPSTTSPGRADCPCTGSDQGSVFTEVPTSTPSGWTVPVNSTPPVYSTEFTEGSSTAWKNPDGITAYRDYYGKGWYRAPSRKSNYNMARCSRSREGYVEFVTTETPPDIENDKPLELDNGWLDSDVNVEFYAQSDAMTYNTNDRKMVLLPVSCISGFLGTCVTMESFSNAYGGQTGNNYRICTSIKGVPTNIPFAQKDAYDCTGEDIGDAFYGFYPDLDMKPYSDCKGYRGIGEGDNCPNAPDLTNKYRARKAATDSGVQTDIRSGGYYNFGRRRTSRRVVSSDCKTLGVAEAECNIDNPKGGCAGDDDDDDWPQRIFAPSSDRLMFYQAGDPCFMYKRRYGAWSEGGDAASKCGSTVYAYSGLEGIGYDAAYFDPVYGKEGTLYVNSYYKNCVASDGNYHWMAFYPPDEDSRCGVGSPRGDHVVMTGHGAYICSGFTDNCAAMATSCGSQGRRRAAHDPQIAPESNCLSPVVSRRRTTKIAEFSKAVANALGATKDPNGYEAGRINGGYCDTDNPDASACFTIAGAGDTPVNTNGAQRPGAYSNEFRDVLSEAAAAGDGFATLNGRRRVVNSGGRRRGNNGGTRFPNGCLYALPKVNPDTDLGPRLRGVESKDSANVPSKIQWDLGGEGLTVPKVMRVHVNDDTGPTNGRYFGTLSLPCPTNDDEAKNSQLLKYFPYFIVRNICSRMKCWENDDVSEIEYNAGTSGHCTKCPAGKWALPTSLGISCGAQCFDCTAGQYQHQTGQETCLKCPAGKYSGKGAAQCTNCPAGKYNTVDVATDCDSCFPGTYSPPQSTGCIDCPAGKFQNAASQGTCKDCSSGEYQSESRQELCNICPPGKYQSQTGQADCTICGFGTASIGSYHPCVGCPLGKFSWYNTDALQVGSCFTLFDTVITSNAPTSGPTGQCEFASHCYCCPMGQFGVSRVTTLTNSQRTCAGVTSVSQTFNTCAECPMGKHAKEAASATCDLCPNGQYNTQSGRALCTECAADHVTGAAGATSATQCIPCPQGKFPNADRSGCITCPSGKYVDNEQCIDCPAGKYSTKGVLEPHAPCIICPSGKYTAEKGEFECNNCPNGKYQGSTESTGCIGTGCPLNYGSPVVAAVSATGTTCVPAPDNAFYNASTGAVVPCPAGRYWDSTSTVPDKVVLPPSSVVSSAETALRACIYAGYDATCAVAEGCQWQQGTRDGCDDAAQYFPTCCERTKQCLFCTQGKYATASAPHCSLQCPEGSLGPGTCETCAAGWVWSNAKAACDPCPLDTYRSESDRIASPMQCLQCPAGLHAVPSRTTCASCTEGTGGYYMAQDKQCKACPEGKFSTSLVDQCSSCPVGKWTTTSPSSECTIMENGYFTDGFTKAQCPAGKYSATRYMAVKTNTFDCSVSCACDSSSSGCPVSGSSVPLEQAIAACKSDSQCYAIAQKLAIGTVGVAYPVTSNVQIHQSLVGQDLFSMLIKVPPDGVTTNFTSIIESSPASKPYKGCIPCLAGMGSNDDRSACIHCPAGKYSDVVGKGCIICPSGKYSVATSSMSCDSCPAGFKSSGSGCEKCTPGRYRNTQMSTCDLCPFNTVTDLPGQQKCSTVCSDAPDENHIACSSTRTCPPGSLWNESGLCGLCPDGRYSDVVNSLACKQCTTGQTSTATSTGCTHCPAGQGADSDSQCVDCESGQYALVLGSSSLCTICPEGKYQNQKAQGGCLTCPAGKHQASAGALACNECNVGTYQPGTASLSCITCPALNRTKGLGATSVLNCSISCTACIANAVYSSSGELTRINVTNAALNSTLCPMPVFRLDGATDQTRLDGPDVTDLQQVTSCGAPVAGRRRLQEVSGGLVLHLPTDAAEAYVAYPTKVGTDEIEISTNITFPTGCVYSPWGAWSAPSATCIPADSGFQPIQYRKRTLILAHGVVVCTGLLVEKEMITNATTCPIACVQYWGNWGSCTRTCGMNAVKNRLRIIKRKSDYGAPPCDRPFSEVRPCSGNDTQCPVDCIYEAVQGNECSEECGGGIMQVHYNILQHAAFGGQECPPVYMNRTCNTSPCPEHMKTPVKPVQIASACAISMFILTFIYNNRRTRIKKK